MPELPDITVYLEALEQRILGRTLTQAHIASPFLLRTIDPPVAACVGHRVAGLRRVGKRIAIGFDNDVWLVLHLMIAGRLHWSERVKKADGRRTLAAFLFDSGCLTLTEAGSQKRASLHMAAGRAGLAALDPGGIDVMTASLPDFSGALTAGNHTLKRALTDPHMFSGIGNAYSDEILHRARLSPVTLTSRLAPDEISRLHLAAREVLGEWTERLRAEAAGGFPEGVTAFRGEMAVHGRYGQPCPVCGAKVQRIRYASNETNYCAPCQTGGRLLADRALSRLLREDWPRTLEELEERRMGHDARQ
ncbi:MAG TPA: DNA-formamidopyrimidine glycosylase family protein [Bryobacteraceae bacterium]|nr:DNA-formamidopyrimidine glycosylase family protein [Bryobacteraceae bacterium]